jgi:prepilin peptidase CpaA
MITATGAMILLVPVLPIAIWVAVSDMKRMKIPNQAVLAMAAVWPLLGWLAVPTWTAWFWGFALMAIALVVGFLMWSTMKFGGGDAKYVAAMAGIFVGADIVPLLGMIAGCMLGSVVVHRVAGRIPAIKRATPDWKSWEERLFFPFGFALSGIVVFYLVAAIWPQV